MASDLLRERASVSERDRHLIMQIGTSVRHANQMVVDLLDLARCNLGNGIPINPESVDLRGICASVVEELRTGFPQAQISLHATASVTGMYDPARMQQVFTNLVGNAVHHGDVTQPINVSLSRNHDGVVFSVQNLGELIPPSAIPHLFSPQARYSSYASKEKGSSAGLGLGLFIASEIVSSHGGTIEVTSTAAQGTAFSVMLPIT